MARQQKTTETRLQYLQAAKRYAKKRYKIHMAENSCHWSHNAADALRDTETEFSDLGTFGVESCEIRGNSVYYLNSGDTYELSIFVRNERFSVTTLGDLAE